MRTAQNILDTSQFPLIKCPRFFDSIDRPVNTLPAGSPEADASGIERLHFLCRNTASLPPTGSYGLTIWHGEDDLE